MVSEFENRKGQIKKNLVRAYEEVGARATEGDDMTDLKDKARGLSRALEFATTTAGLDGVESGIRSLLNDLNRARMVVRRLETSLR